MMGLGQHQTKALVCGKVLVISAYDMGQCYVCRLLVVFVTYLRQTLYQPLLDFAHAYVQI